MKPAGFILTGGQSRRMGRDKAQLAWGTGTLVDHMRRLMATVADPVDLVGRGGIPDDEPGNGPVEGIRTALRVTRSDANLVIAVDLPLVSAEWLAFLTERLTRSRKRAAGCRVGGHVPLCLALDRAAGGAVDDFRRHGGTSLGGMLEVLDADLLEEGEFAAAGFAPDMFRNLNTAEEYLRFRPG